MKESTTTYVGLDVHKDSIVVAIVEGGRDGEVRHYGAISGDLGALDRLIRKLRSRHAKLEFVYEAGPCGYVIYRHLKKQKLSCTVVAPSKTPKKSGDKIKNIPPCVTSRRMFPQARNYSCRNISKVCALPEKKPMNVSDLTHHCYAGISAKAQSGGKAGSSSAPDSFLGSANRPAGVSDGQSVAGPL